MAIVCQKCLYVMSQAEAFGYMSSEIYAIFKKVILPCLVTMYAKKSFTESVSQMSENFIIGILNYTETQCHVCHKYVGWSLQGGFVNKSLSEKELL